MHDKTETYIRLLNMFVVMILDMTFFYVIIVLIFSQIKQTD